MKAALTVSEYIAGFPPHVRVRLNAMRAMIRKAIPRVSESISYGIAAFKVPEGPVVYIAGFKNHVSFFPTSSGIRAFKGEFRGYKVSTGTVQFRLDQELPISLLKRIVLFRLNELGAKGGTQRGRKLGAKRPSRAKCDPAKIAEFDYASLAPELRTLSKPAQRALINAGLTKLSRLAAKSEKQILELHGFGPSSLPKVRRALAERGLKFKV